MVALTDRLASLSITNTTYSTTTAVSKITSNSDKDISEIEAMFAEELKKQEEEKERKLYKDWKPGYRKRPLDIAFSLEDFENEGKVAKWLPNLHKRCGALAIKVGMMPIWDAWGERHACTVLYLDNNVVMKTFTEEKDGYFGVQLGAGERKKEKRDKTTHGTL